MSEKSKQDRRKWAASANAVRVLQPARSRRLPLWIRAPAKGPEYWTGFSRSKLYELEKDGKIRSVSIREAGQKKGTRLFELRSILAFIDSQDVARKAA